MCAAKPRAAAQRASRGKGTRRLVRTLHLSRALNSYAEFCGRHGDELYTWRGPICVVYWFMSTIETKSLCAVSQW